MSAVTHIEDARLAKIASPFVQHTPIQELINGNTFTLSEAAALIPFASKASLAAWLSKNKHRAPEPRYRNVKGSANGAVQIRVLTVEDIKSIREIVMFNRDDTRWRALGPPGFMASNGRSTPKAPGAITK